MKCYLMNKNIEVALVEYNDEVDTITGLYEIINIEFAPLSVYNASKDKSKSILKQINKWFKGRSIPSWRKDLERLLRNLGVSSTDELLKKAYGLSLSDQYWFKDENSKIEWKNINFFDNDFEYIGYLNATLGDEFENPSQHSPNNTTDGMLPKAWIIEEGKRVLVKNTYTSMKQEPLNEWLASEICSRLNFDFCPYWLDTVKNKIVSKCVNFVSSDEEIINAYDIFEMKKKPNDVSDFDHYVQILEENGISDSRIKLEQMFILDFLVMNTDRHMKNYGIIRNVETLKWERMTPIFDSGQAMCCDQTTEEMNFNDGTGKYFSNTNKKFSTYLKTFTTLDKIDLSSLDDLADKYKEMLLKYQNITTMSELRVEKLVDGLKKRISLLEHEIELIKESENEKQLEL